MREKRHAMVHERFDPTDARINVPSVDCSRRLERGRGSSEAERGASGRIPNSFVLFNSSGRQSRRRRLGHDFARLPDGCAAVPRRRSSMGYA